MLSVWRSIRRPLILAAIGAVAGLIYYYAVGCKTGSCGITSSLFSSMVFPGFFGLWVGIVSKGGCCCSGGSCDIDEKK